jgi:hypothetical protein
MTKYSITPISETTAQIDLARFTPHGTVPYSALLKREPEPLFASGRKFVAYSLDGSPLYIAAETIREVAERLA